MNKIYTKVTDQMNFWEGLDPVALAEKYGTPLYVTNERILRQRCRDLKNLVTYPNFVVDYSAKANCGLAFLQIVRSEGLEEMPCLLVRSIWKRRQVSVQTRSSISATMYLQKRWNTQ